MTRMSALIGVVLVAMLTGCAGDMAKQLQSNAVMREKVMGALTSHGDLAGEAIDRLLATDSTRQWVFDKVTSGEAAQAFMLHVAKDRTKMLSLPKWAQPPVRYQICAVKRPGADTAGAAAFIKKVLSNAGRSALKAYGFGIPPRK